MTFANSPIRRRKLRPLALLIVCAISAGAQSPNAWPRPPKFRVVALAERGGGDHQKFVDAARLYLNKLAAENDFAVDYITGTERIDEEFFAQYKPFIQL